MAHTSTPGEVSFVAIMQWAERLKELGMLDKTRYDKLVHALDEAQRGRLDQPPEPFNVLRRHPAFAQIRFRPGDVPQHVAVGRESGERVAHVSFLLRRVTRVIRFLTEKSGEGKHRDPAPR